MTTAQRLRGILAGSAGNLLEYYDWYVYSSFTIYFAHAFFPRGNETAELLNAAAIFAVGFFMRPIGGWLLGAAADRYGRRAALTISVTAMCLGSLAIAVCPTYSQIGLLAPAVLLLARLVQGLSLGGEYGASATYLAEMSDPHNRGFWSGFLYVTLVMGQLLALVILLLMQYVFLTPQQIESWGWRVPFLLGALGAVLIFWLRRQMQESERFERSHEKQEKGGLAVLLQHKRSVLTVCGMTLGGTVVFYTYTIYMQKYLANTLGFPKDTATLVSSASLLAFALMQPAFGALSDRIGRKPLLLYFGVLASLGTVPLLTMLSGVSSPWAAFGLITGALFIASGYTSINAIVKAELFPTQVRALGVALPYAVTVSIFGGTTEYIALWCRQAGHDIWFAYYVSACAAVTLITVLTLRKTDKISEENNVSAQ
ncbi:alpha-ketoglutarate/sugar transporter [Acetobacter indonesiensis NRIC 0313]|jgi:MHS family alpha-ketoglutarate permease-like MFS transporter|uniref:Alpha-ketoglutarate/sugar transporter n=1 Tax=Acetobacter indonesiensis TaxID=104101 RepID=A0A6N3T3G2_9PROT|nr:MFS transporter [Acetobacter indonesiensis]MCG0994083.1 MFS transporter [Acetobacter indonesiensis]MCI1545090.1 MFS transporter [Acetobacter indonesiensis]MCI1764666.1 MFS transporter [Acetobacter indonesiensis]MCP1230586.1 MFS transporter [Acetobacter indonesiensis]OUI95456.1 alpha-ketoglutarate transporter [Acetobacter indonesiensis]